MKLNTIAITSVFLTLLSCKQISNESQSESIRSAEYEAEIEKVNPGTNIAPESGTNIDHEQVTIIDLEPEIITFDWSINHELKSKVISELQRDSKNIDKDIMKFLDDYSKIESDFNKILLDLSNYDSLNTLAYAADGIVNENAIAFKNEVEANGFSIGYSEGMIYIEKNTDFIKSVFEGFLDSISMDFINLYCEEIDSTCCVDAGLIISDELLVQRAFLWGDLLEKAKDLEYKRVAESMFRSYLLFIYLGQDNTPSFDWTTGKFNEILFELMNGIVSKYPNSKASKEFSEYIELLEQSDFERNEKINEYLLNIM
jgi:hypothetical protein